MYILIEHDGTEEQTKVASTLKDIAESKGYTSEDTIGSLGEPIRVYDENLNEVQSFYSSDDVDLSFDLEEEEDGEDN